MPPCIGLGTRNPGDWLPQQSVKQDKIPSPVCPVVAFPTQQGQGPWQTIRDTSDTHYLPLPQVKRQGKYKVQDRGPVCCSELGLLLAYACSSASLWSKPRAWGIRGISRHVCLNMLSKLAAHLHFS